MAIENDGLKFDEGFRIDLLVRGRVIIEPKSVEEIAPVHKKQLLTYLKLADRRLGLLINFNTELIKDGIHRVVNGLARPFARCKRPFARLRLCVSPTQAS